MQLKYLLFFFGLFISSSIHSFKSLMDAIEYAQSVPEFVTSENNDWVKPIYTHTYQKNKPGILDRFLANIGIKSTLWTPKDFEVGLKKVISNPLAVNPKFANHAEEKVIHPGDKIIVIGPLNGAYHSLVRILKQLERLKIIDNQLQVIDTHASIVFTGETLHGSPYILETLTLIFDLLNNSPNHVFFIEGQQEQKNWWYGSNLKDELIHKINHSTNHKIPLEKEIRTLFYNLPLGLDMKVAKTADLLQIRPYSLPQNDPHIEQVVIKNNSKEIYDYAGFDGLDLEFSEPYLTIWSVFSGPTLINQKIYGFYHDSFIVLDIKGNLTEIEATHYVQDTNNPTGFKKQSIEKIVQEKVTHETRKREERKAPIRLGSSMDLTKGISILSKAVKQGIDTRINAINAAGGIKNRKLDLDVLDDQYNPQLALRNIQSLYNNGIQIFLCPVGSPTLEKSIDLMKENKILVLFPSAGSPIFRAPELKGVINLLASYKDEAISLVQYSLSNLNISNVIIFYQDDSYGRPPLATVKPILEKAGKKVIEIPYSANQTDFKDQITKILEQQYDSLAFFSTSTAAMELLRQLEVKNLVGKTLIGLSDLAEATFRQILKREGLTITVSQIIPNLEERDLPIVNEFIRIFKKKRMHITPDSFEGYWSADLMIYFMEQAKDPSDKDELLKIIEGVRNLNYKGLTLHFNPQTRSLANYVWIDTGKGTWIKWNPDIGKAIE